MKRLYAPPTQPFPFPLSALVSIFFSAAVVDHINKGVRGGREAGREGGRKGGGREEEGRRKGGVREERGKKGGVAGKRDATLNQTKVSRNNVGNA